MKLGPEHIGKRVRMQDWDKKAFAIIRGIYQHKVWLWFDDGSSGSWLASEDWEVIEEPKRPSDQIWEMARSKDRNVSPTEFESAIMIYLDAQWEKK